MNCVLRAVLRAGRPCSISTIMSLNIKLKSTSLVAKNSWMTRCNTPDSYSVPVLDMPRSSRESERRLSFPTCAGGRILRMVSPTVSRHSVFYEYVNQVLMRGKELSLNM